VQNGWGGLMGVGTPAAPWLVVRATRKRDGSCLAVATPLKRKENTWKHNVAVKHSHIKYKYEKQISIEDEWHFAKSQMRQHRQPRIVGGYSNIPPHPQTLNPPGIHCGNLPIPPTPTSEGQQPDSWFGGQAFFKVQMSCNYHQAMQIWNKVIYKNNDSMNNLQHQHPRICQLVLNRTLLENKNMNREPINNPLYLSQVDGTIQQIKYIQYLFNLQRWKNAFSDNAKVIWARNHPQIKKNLHTDAAVHLQEDMRASRGPIGHSGRRRTSPNNL